MRTGVRGRRKEYIPLLITKACMIACGVASMFIAAVMGCVFVFVE
jgi:hypothetical protein